MESPWIQLPGGSESARSDTDVPDDVRDDRGRERLEVEEQLPQDRGTMEVRVAVDERRQDGPAAQVEPRRIREQGSSPIDGAGMDDPTIGDREGRDRPGPQPLMDGSPVDEHESSAWRALGDCTIGRGGLYPLECIQSSSYCRTSGPTWRQHVR